jgi:hypothetical protein
VQAFGTENIIFSLPSAIFKPGKQLSTKEMIFRRSKVLGPAPPALLLSSTDYSSRLPRCLIQTLLMIGGVETNPGPLHDLDNLLEIAAMGRPFHLGMLYDARTDQTVPAVTLWNNATLKSDITTDRNSHVSLVYVNGEGINQKEDKWKQRCMRCQIKSSSFQSLL